MNDEHHIHELNDAVGSTAAAGLAPNYDKESS